MRGITNGISALSAPQVAGTAAAVTIARIAEHHVASARFTTTSIVKALNSASFDRPRVPDISRRVPKDLVLIRRQFFHAKHRPVDVVVQIQHVDKPAVAEAK